MSLPGEVDSQIGPTWAEIDLSAIEQNVRTLKETVGEKVGLLAMVKANAYGHGAVPVARAALRAGAAWLGVIRADEAIQLRQAGILAPILLLGYVDSSEIHKVVSNDLIVTLNSKRTAEALSDIASRHGRTCLVHVKVDTGMARFGCAPGEAVELMADLGKLPGLRLQGMYTHFATADEEDKTFTNEQTERFRGVCQEMDRWSPDGLVRHAANSGGILELPSTHFDMVRAGIAMYGLYESPLIGRPTSLTPALSLKSRVARVHRLAEGGSVSYGRTFVAPKPTDVALVPAGYGDGLSRALSNKGLVLIHGQRAPIIGRVCMDNLMVDVTETGAVAEGDEVVLIGRQGADEITANEMASWLNTISYEVVTALAQRVPRIYRRGDQVVEVQRLVVETAPDPEVG